LLGSFTSPITGSTEEKAIEIYAMFKSNPEWNEDILTWLKEDATKTPSGARRSKGTITMDTELG
jgi:hypothetical protein